MAEQPPTPYGNDQGSYEGSIDASIQPNTDPEALRVYELTRNAMRLADTAINSDIEPERKPLVTQPGEVHVPEPEILSPEAIFALIIIASNELVKHRTHAVEVGHMQEDIRNG